MMTSQQLVKIQGIETQNIKSRYKTELIRVAANYEHRLDGLHRDWLLYKNKMDRAINPSEKEQANQLMKSMNVSITNMEHERNSELKRIRLAEKKELKEVIKKFTPKIIDNAVKKKAEISVKRKEVVKNIQNKYKTADPKTRQTLKNKERIITAKYKRVESKLEKFIIKNRVVLNKYVVGATVVSMAAVLAWYYRNIGKKKKIHENTIQNKTV